MPTVSSWLRRARGEIEKRLRPGAVRVRVDRFGADPVASGLVKIQLTVDGAALPAGGLRFRLRSDDGPAFEKALAPAPLPLVFWFAIHTHLLDDGAHRLGMSLESAAGESLWSQPLHLTVRNDAPLAARVRQSLKQHGTPLFVDCTDATHYDFADASLRPWFDRDDAEAHVDALVRAQRVSAAEAEALRSFVRDGYLVLPDLIDAGVLDAVNREIDDAIAKKYRGYVYGTSQRIEHLHLERAAIRALWLDPRYLRIVDLLFDGTARPSQTLTYVFGSEQDAHQDTIHLTPFPAGYMCGTWIALEDVRPSSGELVIYPKSHRLPRVYMKDVGCAKVEQGDWKQFGDKVVGGWARLLADSGLTPEVYRPRRGTVLIWHENLMHAGGKRVDPTVSRRSIVIHSFADGAIAFYDSTGEVGTMAPRELRDERRA